VVREAASERRVPQPAVHHEGTVVSPHRGLPRETGLFEVTKNERASAYGDQLYREYLDANPEIKRKVFEDAADARLFLDRLAEALKVRSG